MLQTIQLANFQSIHSADFELGRLTVFVGSSSSGKSAVFRAVKAATMNPRGASSYISHGSKACKVTVETDKGKISLSVGSGGAAYTVTTEADTKAFSKLNNTVPDQVVEVLGISKEDADLVFAGQFDRPYMLDETGSVVARTLGALTNIDMIFEAVRESNRRKQGSASKLKIREVDLSTAVAKVTELQGIKEKADACTELEVRLAQLTVMNQRIGSLASALATFTSSKAQKDGIRVVSDPPSLERLAALNGRLESFKAALRILVTSKKAVTEAKAELSASKLLALSAESALTTKMSELGVCPLCEGVING